MSYLLGNKVCMESLAADVKDLQSTIAEIISRVGPMCVQSWKFPDKNANDLDIADLLDLYDYDDDVSDPEAKQVSHIALYELVIDRLIFLVQAMSKFCSFQVNSGHSSTLQNVDIDHKGAGSVGLIIKQYWTQMVKLQAQHQKLLSENKMRHNKMKELEKEVITFPLEDTRTRCSTALHPNSSSSHSHAETPTKLGLFLNNNPDLVLMEKQTLLDQNLLASISRDLNNKSSQTYESAFVPCDSCDIIQRKLREAGDIIIKVCTDQGLPCSLKKFKSEVNHVEMLSFNDVTRWMVEQNKDIARIGKQNIILQASIDPLKADVKTFEKKSEAAEVKVQTIERNMKEEVDARVNLCKSYESKLLEQEKYFKQLCDEERRQRLELKKTKDNLDKEVIAARHELEIKKNILTELEVSYKRLESDLVEKKTEAEHAHELVKEVADLKSKLTDVTSILDGRSKSLAKEQGKIRSASRHNESLQAKQDALLARMDLLGKENEDMSQQVASLEEEKSMLEETLNKMGEETKSLEMKVKESEVIIEKLESDKKSLEKSIREAEICIQTLESELKEAKERERIIVEYPDLNGPVNVDLQGTGDVAVDMQNQITANAIRIKILEEQNQTLLQSTQRLTALRSGSLVKVPSGHTPAKLIPLLQTNSNLPGNQKNNNSNWQQSENWKSHENRISYSDSMSPMQHLGNSNNLDESKHKQYLWTHTKKETEPLKGNLSSGVSLTPQEFLIRQGNTIQNLKQKEDKPSRQGRAPSTKLSSVMVPVNATPIIAYTHMKKALGIISGKDNNTKGRPPSGKQYSEKITSAITGDSLRNGHDRYGGTTAQFSCPHCDKTYLKSHDLDIHLTYCSN